MNTNFSQNSSKIIEYWLRNKRWGVLGSLIGLSTTGSSDNHLKYDLTIEDSHKVIAIIKERLRYYRESLVSAVLGTPDFLSSSFLQIGAKQSISVCRIDRNLSLTEFQEIIKEIQKLEGIGNFISNFDSKEKLKEIFSIPDEIADEIFQEDQPNPLEQLKSNISEKQLAKLNPISVGTGFLVGGTYLMTNQHVIPDEKVAEQCVAEFNYVEDAFGDAQTSVYYEFDPKTLFVSNENLDYTLVQLKTGILKKPAGYVFGWLDLIESESNISPGLNREQVEEHLLAGGFTDEQLRAKGLTIEDGNILGDRVIIVQHPKGRHKQIVLNNNRVINNGLYQNFLRYTADSDYGSSGSPVLNTKWELVALHHAAIAKDTNQGNQTQQDNGQSESKIEVVAQQGVRICRIIEDLKKESLSQPKLKSFIQDFVVTSEQLNYSPLPSVLEFDGVRDYVNLSGESPSQDFFSFGSAQPFSIEAWVNPYSDGTGGVIISKCYADKPLEGEYILRITEKGNVEFNYRLPPWQVSEKRRGETSKQTRRIEIPPDISFTPPWYKLSKLATKKTLPFGEFSHIAVTYDGKEMKIYINGKQEGTDGKQKETDVSPVLQNYNTFIPVVVGTSLNSPGSSEDQSSSSFKHFKGIIAEVRLWKKARNEDEIKANMYRRLNAQQEIKNGLVGYWRFEEGNDNTVYNLASRNEQGIIYTAKWLTGHNFPPLPLPFGLKFDGEDDYVDCGDDESLQITDAITIEAWVKHNYGDGLIVDKVGIDARDKSGYSLSLHGGKIRVELHNPDIRSQIAKELTRSKIPELQKLIDEAKTAKTILDTQNNLPRDNAWHHIAFTWGNTPQAAREGNRANELPEVEVYIDGRRQNIVVIEGQAKSILVEGRYKTVGLFKGPIGTPFQYLSIGGRENAVHPKSEDIYFNGSIAEVRLWEVARTQNQINANMYRRLNISQEELEKSKGEGLVGYWRLDDGGKDNIVRNLASDKNYGTVHGEATWICSNLPSQE